MVKNKSITLSIDSDILRSLSFLEMLISTHGEGNVDLNKVNDALLKKYFGYFNKFLKLIKEDKIKIVIEETIYQENKHSENMLNFIKKYAYFPDINMINYQEQAMETRKLAYAYCSPYEYKGVTYEAPMQSTYVAEINLQVPTNDAFAMAQASRGKRCFITANAQHLIFNKKNSTQSNDRSKGIVHINMSMGYFSTDEQDNILVPKPLSIATLGAIIKDGIDTFMVVESDDKIVKANIILN